MMEDNFPAFSQDVSEELLDDWNANKENSIIARKLKGHIRKKSQFDSIRDALLEEIGDKQANGEFSDKSPLKKTPSLPPTLAASIEATPWVRLEILQENSPRK